MPIRESGIKAQILKYLNSQPGCYATSFPGSQASRGQPDIVGCYHGQMLALEVKSPGAKKETMLQREVLKKWEQAGATAQVVRTVAQVRGLLEHTRNQS